MSALECYEGFKFGCDPELFVKDEKGQYVSAAGLIPGTKEAPHRVEHGAVQVDGMAAEFNIDPAESFEDWNRNIMAVMGQLQQFLPKGYTLDAVPSVVFDETIFKEAPDEAKLLGCTPDFNAWTGGINSPPSDPSNPFLRTASGHVHIGWTDDVPADDVQHILNCRDLVKQFDWYLGAWSLSHDSDPIRRRLYGRAGACRYKPYGVEYRVLSNFWVTDKSRRLDVWNRMQSAINAMSSVFLPSRVDKYKSHKFNEKLQKAINTSSLATDFCEMFQYPMRTLDESYLRV